MAGEPAPQRCFQTEGRLLESGCLWCIIQPSYESPVETSRMDEQRVEFMAKGGTRIRGILALPSAAKASVVLAHGITVEKNEDGFYSDLAAVLADDGLASLRFDFRGHGESDGDPEDMTIEGEIADLHAAVRFLAPAASTRLPIVATSFGASVAVLFAARHPSRVASLSLLCPVLDYQRTFLKPETQWAKEFFSPDALAAARRTRILDLDGFPLGLPLLDEFRKLQPGETLLSLHLPVLIMHGTNDSMVPYAVAEHYGTAYRSGRFVPVSGADHGFEGFEDEVYSEVCAWIESHLV